MRDIRPELLDELRAGYEKPSDLLGEDGIFRAPKTRLLERALDAELSEHLGYAAAPTTATGIPPRRC